MRISFSMIHGSIYPYSPIYYACSSILPHSTPRGGGIEKCEEVRCEVCEGLQHDPYDEALQHLYLSSTISQRICGNLIFTFKITNGVLESPTFLMINGLYNA